MSAVGHPKVTADAYANATPRQKLAAVRFAEAAVSNGLPKYSLPHATELRLKAQIERDFLVHLVANGAEQ